MKISKKFAWSSFIISVLFLWFIVSITTDPVDTPTKKVKNTPIRTIVFDQCKKYPEEADALKGFSFIIHETYLQPGMSGRIPSCEGITLEVLEDIEHKGERWIKVRYGNNVGWNTYDSIEGYIEE